MICSLAQRYIKVVYGYVYVRHQQYKSSPPQCLRVTMLKTYLHSLLEHEVAEDELHELQSWLTELGWTG